jgi:hypothetical protein
LNLEIGRSPKALGMQHRLTENRKRKKHEQGCDNAKKPAHGQLLEDDENENKAPSNIQFEKL